MIELMVRGYNRFVEEQARRHSEWGSVVVYVFFFFSSRRRHTRFDCDWSSDVCSSDLGLFGVFDARFVLLADLLLVTSDDLLFGDQVLRTEDAQEGNRGGNGTQLFAEIGRASCRERV